MRSSIALTRALPGADAAVSPTPTRCTATSSVPAVSRAARFTSARTCKVALPLVPYATSWNGSAPPGTGTGPSSCWGLAS